MGIGGECLKLWSENHYRKLRWLLFAHALAIPNSGSMSWSRAVTMCWSSLTNARRYGGLSKLPHPKAMRAPNQKATNAGLRGVGRGNSVSFAIATSTENHQRRAPGAVALASG